MPPPTYNAVWLDEFESSSGRRSSPRRQREGLDDAPRVLVHSSVGGGGASFNSRASSMSEQSEVKVPLLNSSSGANTSAESSSTASAYQATRGDSSSYDQSRPLLNRGSLVECRYQSTQDSGYEQSQDECNFPPPLDVDYNDVLDDAYQSSTGSNYDPPPPPEVAFETSLDYAYEQDLAQGIYHPTTEDDGYAESCASSSQTCHLQHHHPQHHGGGGDAPCDHSKNQCAYMHSSPFGDFIPNASASESLQNGSLSQGSSAMASQHSSLARYSQTISPVHQSVRMSPARQQNGSIPPPPATFPDMPQERSPQIIPAQLQLQHPIMPNQGQTFQNHGAVACAGGGGGGGGAMAGGAGGGGGAGGPQGPTNQGRNTARLTLEGLDLEIQVAPPNCYSGFAPETILRASKAKQRTPAPVACQVVNPEEVGEMILSDVSRDASLTPETDFKEPARMCRNCFLRVAAFLAHIGFFVCVAILGVQIPLKKRYDVQVFILRHDTNAQRELPKPYDEVALVTACVMLFLCYLVALGESYTADTESFVNNAMSKDILQSYMRELREQVPIVGWDVVCYHLETRQVTRTTRDRWGNETTSTTEEEVKVMTHRETLRFPFRIVKDISGDINLKGTAITKMEFHQMYGFLDMATAQKFNQIKERLRERNRYRDEKMEFKEIFALDNLKAHVTVFGEYGCLRQLMRPKIFCFFSCFLFSWPFRLILKLTTKKKKYTVIKVLGL